MLMPVMTGIIAAVVSAFAGDVS